MPPPGPPYAPPLLSLEGWLQGWLQRALHAGGGRGADVAVTAMLTTLQALMLCVDVEARFTPGDAAAEGGPSDEKLLECAHRGTRAHTFRLGAQRDADVARSTMGTAVSALRDDAAMLLQRNDLDGLLRLQEFIKVMGPHENQYNDYLVNQKPYNSDTNFHRLRAFTPQTQELVVSLLRQLLDVEDQFEQARRRLFERRNFAVE